MLEERPSVGTADPSVPHLSGRDKLHQQSTEIGGVGTQRITDDRQQHSNGRKRWMKGGSDDRSTCGAANVCLAANGERRTGRLVRIGLVLSAIVVCGFTVWEEKDLVYTGVNVIYKSAYWRNVEVEGWQMGDAS